MKKLSPVTLLSLGYIITIFIGTVLLSLPIASKIGEVTPLIDALFTATSATCVTGLIPFDTFTHWTLFGQIVILILIQIGGLGFMTVITIIFMIFRKKIGLYNRTVLMQSAGSYNISQITVLIKRIIIGTIIFEGLGTIVLFIGFMQLPNIEVSTAIYRAVFHSISAFCNAGFDVLGATGGSLTELYSSPLILVTIMILIVIGGSGFIVWSDLIDNKFKFTKLQIHSKIVITWTVILILIPAFMFYMFEFTKIGQQGEFANLPFQDKLVNAFFLSISPRTAGFNTLDLTKLTSAGKLLTIILMFIGGNSGSTAGGIKVTTFLVVMTNLIASAKGSNKVVLFKRTISDTVVKQASSLFLAYLVMILVSTILITGFDNFNLEEALFEVVSAIGTVGLSLGVSGAGSIFTKLILIFLMYAGRLGALTLLNLFVKNNNQENLENPKGRILVG